MSILLNCVKTSSMWELLGQGVMQEPHQERRKDLIVGPADPRNFYQRLI